MATVGGIGDERISPEWADILASAVEKRLCDVHTAMPAEISSYDSGTNLAIVVPVLQRKYVKDDDPVNLPLISNVPVAFPRMGEGFLRFPVNSGDSGMLVFQERSIDRWLELGRRIDPEDPRKFSLSDAVFVPGLNPKNKPLEISAEASSLELKYKEAFIEITRDSKFKIKNKSEELLTLFDDLLTALLTVKTNTILGPQPLVPPVLFIDLKTRLDKLKG